MLLTANTNFLVSHLFNSERAAKYNFVTRFNRENIMSQMTKDLVDFTASRAKL